MRGDGSSNEERLETGQKYRTDRTEGISDGVFAVSLTLLILDVRPPEGDVSQLVHGLVLIAPRLGTFALSFAIVAYYWLVHHLIFASLRGVKVALICRTCFFYSRLPFCRSRPQCYVVTLSRRWRSQFMAPISPL